ncbi:MAG: hypothetical protein HOO96_43930 [Polyangiaceae bacterium]|nr:hypothetical protein [Polyangiaceae bacterium]
MTRIGLSRAAIAGVALVLLGSVAHAAEPPPREAQLRMQEGYALSQQNKNAEAREKYLQALAIYSAAKALGNLAAIEEGLGLYADALGHLRAYLEHPEARPELAAEIRTKHIPYLEGKTGHLRIVAGDGLSVFVNDRMVGTAPLKAAVDLMPGPYTVRAGDAKLSGTIEAGQSIDAKLQGSESTSKVNVVIRMDEPKTAPKALPIVAHSAEDNHPPPNDSDAGLGRFVGPIVLGVVGLGGIGTGIGFALAGSSTRKDFDTNAATAPCADRASQACTDQQSRIDSASTQRTFEIVGYSVGGAALVGAAIWTALVWKKPSRGVSIDLQPKKNGAYLGLTGSF